MSGRPDARQQCGVAWICDGGQHTAYARGVSARLQNAAQVRNLQPVLIGFQNIVGPQTIDRDHQEAAGGRLSLSAYAQQKNRAEKPSGTAAAIPAKTSHR